MIKNVGTLDRALRALLGVALIALAFTLLAGGVWQWVAVFAGLVAIMTSAVSFCPAYRLLGMRTCPIDA